MRSMWKAAAGVALVTGGLAGCGAADEAATDRPFAYYDTKGNPEGDAASLAGTLEIAEDCVYVVADGRKIVPIFPVPQTSLEDGELVVNGRKHADGADVSFGGGEQSSPPAETVVPEGCAGDGYWIVAPS